MSSNTRTEQMTDEHKTRYSKTCFVRPLIFSTENGRKRQVTFQRGGDE